ncbi:MAG TPA: glycosyltransferase family 2 protein [Acidimicrobiales bacterium]|nr:glycosyltransferase family 2 protein [Acidimicrobiales bacterium]
MEPQAPAVVAVVVASDPGPWLEETLAGLAAQDYPNLSVLVVDNASVEDPTPRVAAVMPGAYVRRLEVPSGYSAAANEALEVVEGAAFYLMCHDDVALEPDAVRLLVEEAFRSNAGLVAPKLVAWDDPQVLRQVGMGADKAGTPVPLAQPGELDQEQHDAVRDVFVAPGGAVLVRSDLFDALGGFDPAMVLYGEDVDLSWRAQVAGARVVVAPAARARHMEAASRGLRDLSRLPGGAIPALVLRRRHELRAALTNYGFWHRLRVEPQLVVHSVAEVLMAGLTGRRESARAAASAWAWNLRRPGQLRRRRRRLATCRRLGDGEVRLLQSSSTERLSGLVEDAFDRAATHVPHRQAAAGPTLPPPRPWLIPAVWGLIVVVLVFGSRAVLTQGLPAVGTMARFPSAWHLLGAYAASGRQAGLGQAGSAPLAFALLGVLGVVLGDSMGLLRDVVVVGMLPLGALGAYRAARPLGSVRGQLVATAVYLALPLPYSAIANGRWAAAVAYGAFPWVVGHLGRASGLAPFDQDGPAGPRRWVGLGLVLALAGALVPAAVPVAVLAGVGLVLGSVTLGRGGTGELAGSVRALVAAAAAGAVAWALAFPWSYDLVSPGAQGSAVLGVPEPVYRAVGLGSLLGFRPVPGGVEFLGWMVLLAAALPLLLGRGWRLAWSVRLWWVAILCWAAAWAGGRGWLGFAVPEPGVMAAMAGAALALSAGIGMATFEADLVGYRVGWRQLVSLLAAAGVTLAVGGAALQSVSGRWGAGTADLSGELAPLLAPVRPGYRVLWVGDPRAVPLSGWARPDGTSYAVAYDGPGDLLVQWPPPDPGRARAADADLSLAEQGATVQLGRLLGDLGIRYLVVPTRQVPSIEPSPDLAPPPRLVAALSRQLDLKPVPVDPSLQIFENTTWTAADRRPAVGSHRPAGRALALALEGLAWAAALALAWSARRRPEDRGEAAGVGDPGAAEAAPAGAVAGGGG